MTANPSPSPILESPEHQCIAVIGAGSWGTTLAQLLAEKGKDVRLWVREPDVCEGLRRDRINHTFLPGIRLSSRITFTREFPVALNGAGLVDQEYARMGRQRGRLNSGGRHRLAANFDAVRCRPGRASGAAASRHHAGRCSGWRQCSA